MGSQVLVVVVFGGPELLPTDGFEAAVLFGRLRSRLDSLATGSGGTAVR